MDLCSCCQMAVETLNNSIAMEQRQEFRVVRVSRRICVKTGLQVQNTAEVTTYVWLASNIRPVCVCVVFFFNLVLMFVTPPNILCYFVIILTSIIQFIQNDVLSICYRYHLNGVSSAHQIVHPLSSQLKIELVDWLMNTYQIKQYVGIQIWWIGR